MLLVTRFNESVELENYRSGTIAAMSLNAHGSKKKNGQMWTWQDFFDSTTSTRSHLRIQSPQEIADGLSMVAAVQRTGVRRK